MREIAAGVYNVLKSTQQHAMPVGEFMDRLSSTDQEVEANLSTVFQSVRGSKQYWFQRHSEVKCMVREYGLNLGLSRLQIARRRHPSSGFSIKSTSKPFKHLEFLPYTYIRSIINFDDTDGMTVQTFTVLHDF